MLNAYKRQAHTALSLSMVEVRQMELDYFYSNILAIGGQSALFAGFSFGIIAGYSSSNTDLSLYAYTASIGGSSSFVVPDLTWLNSGSADSLCLLAIELVYLVATVSAMGNSLYTLYISLITSIIGPELALRGPEGSFDRAVVGMADVNREMIVRFRHTLLFFFVIVVLTTFMLYHLIAAIICFSLLTLMILAIAEQYNDVARSTTIAPMLIVTGHFEPDLVSRTHRPAKPAPPSSAQEAADRPPAPPAQSPPAPERRRGLRGILLTDSAPRVRAPGSSPRSVGLPPEGSNPQAPAPQSLAATGAQPQPRAPLSQRLAALPAALGAVLQGKAQAPEPVALYGAQPSRKHISKSESEMGVLADAPHETRQDRYKPTLYPSAVAQRMLSYWQGPVLAVETDVTRVDLFVRPDGPIAWLFGSNTASAVSLPPMPSPKGASPASARAQGLFRTDTVFDTSARRSSLFFPAAGAADRRASVQGSRFTSVLAAAVVEKQQSSSPSASPAAAAPAGRWLGGRGLAPSLKGRFARGGAASASKTPPSIVSWRASPAAATSANTQHNAQPLSTASPLRFGRSRSVSPSSARAAPPRVHCTFTPMAQYSKRSIDI